MNSLRKLFFSSLFIIGLIAFSSCSSVRYTSSGQPLAQYYSFSKDTSKRFLALLDTNNIYVQGLDLVRTYKSGKIEKGFYYMFLKFSNNGIAFYSDDTKEPFNQLNIHDISGQYCYFKVVGNE